MLKPIRLLKGGASLGYPHLLLDVLEGSRTDYRVADEEDVRLRVGQGPESVVILLTRGVEQAQRVGLSPDHDRDGVVVKDCGYVLAREAVSGIGDEEAGLAHRAVSHYHALDRLHIVWLGGLQIYKKFDPPQVPTFVRLLLLMCSMLSQLTSVLRNLKNSFLSLSRSVCLHVCLSVRVEQQKQQQVQFS